MSRVNVTSDSYDNYELLGWFESSKADRWTDVDFNGNGSGGTGRGQAVLRTAGGKWVLERWSNWEAESDTYTYISPDEARDWLLRNGENEAAEQHFGDIPEEEDRRAGRPEIGNVINVRLGDLLGRVDEFASVSGVSRAEAVRELVLAGLVRHYGH